MGRVATFVAVALLLAGNLSSSALSSGGVAVAKVPHPPLSPAKRAKAEALKNEANELFKAKKWEEALSLYEQAAETDPSNIMILCNRAFAHIKLENFENAVADAEQSILLDPTFPKAYYRRATARMMQGKLKLALNDLRKVTRLRPSDAAVHDKLRECEKMWRVQVCRIGCGHEAH